MTAGSLPEGLVERCAEAGEHAQWETAEGKPIHGTHYKVSDARMESIVRAVLAVAAPALREQAMREIVNIKTEAAMSWSVNKTVEALEELNDLLPAYELPPIATEQIVVAREAAKAIIHSGAVGRGKQFAVSLSGHANPGHEPTPGWSNDCVTVSVSQLPPAPKG